MYREIIDRWGGGERRGKVDRRIDHGLAILFEIVRVLNYARLKIDISFWSSYPFYGAIDGERRSTDFSMEWPGERKNFYQRVV